MPGKGSSQHQQASSATKSRARKRNVESTLRAHEIPQPSEIVLTLHAISHRFDIGLTPLTGLHKLSKLPEGASRGYLQASRRGFTSASTLPSAVAEIVITMTTVGLHPRHPGAVL